MKKSWVKSVLLAGVMTTAAACAPVGGTAYHKIDAEAAKTMLDQETGIVLVDVRRPDEYAQGHIPSWGDQYPKRDHRYSCAGCPTK